MHINRPGLCVCSVLFFFPLLRTTVSTVRKRFHFLLLPTPFKLELQYIVQCVQGDALSNLLHSRAPSSWGGLVEGHIRHCSPLTVH